MSAFSSGDVENNSPFPVNSARGNKNSVLRSGARRGSTASWMHPLSSTEVPDLDLPHNPPFSDHGLQVGSGDDIAVDGGGAKSLSLLSATEVSPMRVCDATDRKPRLDSASSTSNGKRKARSFRSYARLTGLLTRRGGEGNPRKNVTVSSTSHLARTLSGGGLQSSATGGNPLQRPCSKSGVEDLSQNMPLDDRGCHWSATPSPKSDSSLHRCRSESPSGAPGAVPCPSVVNSTIHSRSWRELCASPLASQSSRASPHATVQPDGGSARKGSGLDSSGAQFVPLGSTDVANRNSSPSRLQRSCGSGVDEDKATTSFSLRNRSHRRRLISGSSLSMSASQSLGQIGSTRVSPGQTPRNTGDSEISMHVPVNVRSLRDAKVVLLRRTQHGNAHSLRSSRTCSFQRSQSNTSSGEADPLSKRVTKTSASIREKRPTTGTAAVAAGGGPAESAYSMVVGDDDVVRISVPPATLNSSLTHWDEDSPLAGVVPDMGSGKSEHYSISGAHRRFSRPEDKPLLEVIETSSCASQGWCEVGNGAPLSPATGEQATRGRVAVAASSSSKSIDRRIDAPSRSRSPFQRSYSARHGTFYPPRMPSGLNSLSRTGADGSSTSSEEEIRLREQHRNRFGEVLRQLNAPARSMTVDDRLTATSMRNNSSYPSPRDTPVRGDASQMDNSPGAWAGIGGLDWGGGLVAFCASTTGGGNANMSTTVNANGGGGGDSDGWLGVGGTTNSEDWYARMRKRLEEEEKVEATVTTVIASDANVIAAAPSGESAPMQAAEVTSTIQNKESAQSEMPMLGIDSATTCEGPLLLPRSNKSSRAPSATPPQSRLPLGEPKTPPPSVIEPLKPNTSPLVSPAGEHFVRRLQLSSPTRMQLSPTRAALGNADGTAATTHPRPPEESVLDEVSTDTGSLSTRPSPQATALTVPDNAMQCPDGPRGTLLPILEVNEPLGGCLSVLDADDDSATVMGGSLTLAPQTTSASRQPSEGFPLLMASASTEDPSHGQPDSRSHCALPRIVPRMSMTVLKPSLPGQHSHSTIPTSVPSRVHNGVRLTLLPSSGAAQPVSVASVTPTKEGPVIEDAATTQGSVCTGADVNSALSHNSSAPASRQGAAQRKQSAASARSTEKPTSSSGAPAAIIASARLSNAW
ncbi:hypothetical protein, conserved [Leishmania tarentolae]|uniref:Uncharacterized protein n=1 Tax=Leishmania tarentolae TaxID=5689 RepID=A0A640KEB9_LEITA|nr:hypothetical protein, conserved [Leishmania tarentolae]